MDSPILGLDANSVDCAILHTHIYPLLRCFAGQNEQAASRAFRLAQSVYDFIWTTRLHASTHESCVSLKAFAS